MRLRHFLQMRWQRSVHIFFPQPRQAIHFLTVSGLVGLGIFAVSFGSLRDVLSILCAICVPKVSNSWSGLVIATLGVAG